MSAYGNYLAARARARRAASKLWADPQDEVDEPEEDRGEWDQDPEEPEPKDRSHEAADAYERAIDRRFE